MDITTRDRAKGMVVGGIVGDALGAPLEFSPKNYHKTVTRMTPCRTFGFEECGIYTDDTSMTLCIMQAYLDRGGKYDLRAIADEFLLWKNEGRHTPTGRCFDIGGATAAGLGEYQRSGSLKNGAEVTQGNAPLMWFAPAYLIARNERRHDVIHELTALTHDSSTVHEIVDRYAEMLDLHMQGHLPVYGNPYPSRDYVPNGGWIKSTLQAALWAFRTTKTFEDALIAAVNLGGDADTIGCVTGILAGSYYGYEAIPKEWLKDLKDYADIIEPLTDRFLDSLRNTQNIHAI